MISGDQDAATLRRVLVTGVAGFIGSHVAEALVRDGVDVIGLDGLTDSYDADLKRANLTWLTSQPRFEFVEADLRTAALEPLLEGVDAVINEAALAGLPRSWRDLDAYMACNVVGLSRLIDACRAVGVRRLVQASTSSVYGREAVGDETMPTRPVSPYGVSKLAAEHLLLAHVHEHDFPAVILRYFSIYGPRQRPDMAYRIFTQHLLDATPITVFGDGRQSRSNTYVDDCVRATMLALAHGEVGEVYNIGGGQELALLDAINIIAGELSTRPEIHHAPARPGDQRRTRADIGKARERLGYMPSVSPLDGLRAQVAWHRTAATPVASAGVQQSSSQDRERAGWSDKELRYDRQLTEHTNGSGGVMTHLLMRMWWAVLLGAVAAGAAAFVVLDGQPEEYQARARLLVGELSGNFDDIRASEALANTYAELATTDLMLGQAIAEEDLDISVRELRGHVTATTVGSSRVLLITVRMQDPGRAMAAAEAVASVLATTAASVGHVMILLDAGDAADRVPTFLPLLVAIAAAGGATLVAAMLLPRHSPGRRGRPGSPAVEQ